MKMMRLTLTSFAAAAIAAAPAWAYHSGGVAECEGCHTMHNTKGSGRAVPLAGGVGNGAKYLLQGSDQASTCLNCHNQPDTAPSSYHISTDDSMFTTTVTGTSYANPANKAPVEMTPGGDFGWIKVTRPTIVRGTAGVNDGNTHGHNIVAADYNYIPDPSNATAPGGTYPASNLACSSCHDPHGKYRRFADGTVGTTGLPIFNSGSYASSNDPIAGVSAVGVYRLLAGVGYQPKSLSGNFAFVNPSPTAVVNSTYNRSEAAGQTHVAYGQGMSEWCANCHTQMLENAYVSGASGHRHPAGNNAKLTAAIVANYNAYVSSGIMTNTDVTKAYSTLAPFELGTADYTVLKPLAINTDTKDQSAQPTSNVACISCHRAHASGFAEGTRFYLENEFMTIADASNAGAYDPSTTSSTINGGYNVAEQTNAYYGRPATVFGPQARNYCNKCHAKD
jgi:hypothetical protein